MKNILHITPHLGGGVGTVLLNWLVFDKSNYHSIITLDYANENATHICKENNIRLFSQIQTKEILSEILKSDITVIHFWNHPLLYDFLIRNTLPESRIIFWSHISGANPPYVFNEKLFDICDKFVFTSPISYKYVKNNSKTACILSTGGIERFKSLQKENHEGFISSYIGTIDYAKMHSEYLNTMLKTDVDRIIIAGAGAKADEFANADKRIEFKGKVPDISDILKISDVFAYMLNPNHYGTAEQVLQEAMASGVVPVVLDNPCEKNLIKHMETGLVAENLNEYVKYINLLKQNPDLRNKLSEKAKIYADKNFSLDALTKNWNSLFDVIIKLPKTDKKWDIQKTDITSFDVFLESLGSYRTIFENKSAKELKAILKQPNWDSETKGTPKQYFKFLSGMELEKLCSFYGS